MWLMVNWLFSFLLRNFFNDSRSFFAELSEHLRGLFRDEVELNKEFGEVFIGACFLRFRFI